MNDPAGGRRWRSTTAVVLLTLSCLLAPPAVAAVWASQQVTDTDRHVASVAPLAADPVVQHAVADRVTHEILTAVDVRAITTEALDSVANGLPPRIEANVRALRAPLADAVADFIRRQVLEFVRSPAFATLWAQANRIAHARLVVLLEGQQDRVVTAQADSVTLNLAPVISAVKERLLAAGYSTARFIPVVDRSVVLMQSSAVTRAQDGFGLLNTLRAWLPLTTFALLVAGLFLARDRRRALVGWSAGIVAGMVALALAVAVLRTRYLNALPTEALSRDAAGAVFDVLVDSLRRDLWLIGVLAVVVALVAFGAGRLLRRRVGA
ncbi:hypothetical protein [Kribbella sp. CA-247076]|uniref:hypothetical protein n=1 Tax=Kribbella sp. CA-247076 TaxID=3239941 RepID=UPI003D8AC5B9